MTEADRLYKLLRDCACRRAGLAGGGIPAEFAKGRRS